MNSNLKIIDVSFYDKNDQLISNISKRSILKRSFKTELEVKNFCIDLLTCNSPVFHAIFFLSNCVSINIVKSIKIYED